MGIYETLRKHLRNKMQRAEARRFNFQREAEVILVTGPGKKNRKKWCRGKVGIKHQLGEWEALYPPPSRARVKKCQVCRKVMDWYYPRFDEKEEC